MRFYQKYILKDETWNFNMVELQKLTKQGKPQVNMSKNQKIHA